MTKAVVIRAELTPTADNTTVPAATKAEWTAVAVFMIKPDVIKGEWIQAADITTAAGGIWDEKMKTGVFMTKADVIKDKFDEHFPLVLKN